MRVWSRRPSLEGVSATDETYPSGPSRRRQGDPSTAKLDRERPGDACNCRQATCCVPPWRRSTEIGLQKARCDHGRRGELVSGRDRQRRSYPTGSTSPIAPKASFSTDFPRNVAQALMRLTKCSSRRMPEASTRWSNSGSMTRLLVSRIEKRAEDAKPTAAAACARMTMPEALRKSGLSVYHQQTASADRLLQRQGHSEDR